MGKEEYLKKCQAQAINHIYEKNPQLVVLKYENSHTMAHFLCEDCGNEFDFIPDALHRRQCRCPVCNDKSMAHPKTTIEQDRPDLIEWLVNKNDKILGTKSRRIIQIKCPACGAAEEVAVNNFVKRIHTCQNCNRDGISYPNKILREFLKQIKEQVEFTQTEWNPKWAGNYKYDGHFIKNGIHYIIEMHGPQHYEKTSIWDFEAQKIRDAEKTKLANKNKIEQIIIDCRKSNFEYIKNNFQYTVLENFNSKVDDSYILSREAWWKKVFCSRKFGYNSN